MAKRKSNKINYAQKSRAERYRVKMDNLPYREKSNFSSIACLNNRGSNRYHQYLSIWHEAYKIERGADSPDR